MIGADQIEFDPLRFIGNATHDHERGLRTAHRGAERRDLDARQRTHALQELEREAVALIERRVLGRRQVDTHHQHAICREAAVDALEDEERAGDEPRAHEQHDRQRDLDHDEQVSRATALGAGAGAAARPERVGDVGFRRLQGRHEAEDDPRQQRHAEREQEHRYVDRDARLVRHVELGHHGDDGADRAEGEQHAQRAADERQKNALGEQLPQQPLAAGADRHPDGHLPRPRGPARELQVGDVGARDQEKERDPAQQQLQARAHLAAGDRHVEIVPEAGGKALRGERGGLLRGEARVQRAQLLLGDGARHAGGEADDRIDPLHVGTRGRKREPESLAAVPAETRRHDADDRVLPAVQLKRPPDRGWIALEQPEPQAMAQHHDRFGLTIGPDVRGLNGPAGDRGNPEKVEGVAREQNAAEALRRELAGHQHGFGRRRHHVREGRHLAQGAELVERVGVPAAAVDRAGARRPDLARPRVGIRRDEDSVDDAEDRRRRADPKGQRQQRDENESRAAPERSDRVTEILRQWFEQTPHAHLP